MGKHKSFDDLFTSRRLKAGFIAALGGGLTALATSVTAGIWEWKAQTSAFVIGFATTLGAYLKPSPYQDAEIKILKGLKNNSNGQH